MKIPHDMQLGSIHKTLNDGDLEIVKYLSSTNITVRFIATGFEKVVRSEHIRKGSIKDRLRPSVFGVGFVGVGRHKPSIKGLDSDPYKCWVSMLRRCYDKKFQKRSPWYVGCVVDVEWHNFQNFADWYEMNHPKDGAKYHLDKDILIHGNKIYSPNTCTFLTPKENSVASHARIYCVKSPDGEIINIYNMTQFCRDNNLQQGNFSKMLSGKLKQHKGWTKP